jgi:hypothetical protein
MATGRLVSAVVFNPADRLSPDLETEVSASAMVPVVFNLKNQTPAARTTTATQMSGTFKLIPGLRGSGSLATGIGLAVNTVSSR